MACTNGCVKPTPSQAHCGACHHTFSGVTLFDQHRKGGVCHHPTAIPGAKDSVIPTYLDLRGVWRYNIPRTNVSSRNTDTQTD